MDLLKSGFLLKNNRQMGRVNKNLIRRFIKLLKLYKNIRIDFKFRK
jgi:hypothetical protein